MARDAGGAEISHRDLVAALHLNGQVADPQDVRLARLERNGEISLLTPKPRVVHEVRIIRVLAVYHRVNGSAFPRVVCPSAQARRRRNHASSGHMAAAG